MKVRELRALLTWLEQRGASADDTVLFDESLQTVTVVRVRPGMHQAFAEDECGEVQLQLTEADKQFLRLLRIPT
ncbi:MAG: hypothetical protein ACE14M_07890 [Terriglobales bacterium]